SQDAYPGRSVVLREILFRAGRSGVPGLANRARKNRRLRLLGSMVPGIGATHGPARRPDFVLSHGDWLASARKGKVRRSAIFRLGNDAAQPRDREWLLRGGDQSS